MNHIPGDRKTDICTDPLARRRLAEIRERLLQSSTIPSHHVRIEILRSMDNFNCLNERRVNYFDIYDLMTQVLFEITKLICNCLTHSL